MQRRSRVVGAVVLVALALLLVVLLIVGRAHPRAGEDLAERDPGGAAQRGSAGRGAGAPDAAAAIAGTAVDEAHRPVPSARVCARDLRDGPRFEACTLADPRGHFELAALRPSEYAVVAVAAHHAPADEVGVVLHAHERRADLELVLASGGAELVGTVTDLGGGAVSHARVTAYSQFHQRTTASVETDEAGGFHLWSWPGSSYLEARADGYVDGSEIASAPGTVAIELVSDATIAGTVVDAATHQPIAGAAVDWDFAQGRVSRGSHQAISDERGHFEIHGLEAARYAGRATTSNGLAVSDGSVAVAVGQRVDGVTLAIHPATSIVGEAVIEGSPPRPCPHPRVIVDYQAILDAAAADGRFRLDGLLPGIYRLRVSCEGFTLVAGEGDIDVGTHEVHHVWTFGAGATVRGVVRDDRGAPVAGARVGAASAEVITHDDGRFEVTGLPAGRCSLSARTSAGATASATLQLDAHTATTHDLVVEDGGSLAGVIVDRAGTPQGHVQILASDGDSVQFTDQEGRFRFDGLAPGELDLRVETATYANREHATIRRHATTEVRFVIDAGTEKITGAVTDELGRPVADALVTLGRDQTTFPLAPRSVETGPDGAFEVAALAPGTYTVRAVRGGRPPVVANHVPTGTSVKLQLDPPCSLAGTARAADGTPLESFEIIVEDADEHALRDDRFFATGGRYHLDDVAAGMLEVFVVTDRRRGHTRIELAPGAHRELDLALAVPVQVTGRVLDRATQAPLAGARVDFYSNGPPVGLESPTARTDASGRFVAGELPRGQLRVWISAPGYAAEQLDRPDLTGSTVDLGDIALTAARTP